MNNNNPFFPGGRSFGPRQSIMTINGLTCEVNMPRALKSIGVGANEGSHGLPPYNKRAAFLVDEYPAAPIDWLRSAPGLQSYMVPVEEDHGLWLDFNGCWDNSHHVAIVVSVQGINGITGTKTDVIRLEQYKHNCPRHNVPFTGERRCPTCGYEWPAQNYIATTGTPRGSLWIDGFRTADGTVRQWVFTTNEGRSVAKAIIGEERVHAIGVAFFLSKDPKPAPVSYGIQRSLGGQGMFDLDYLERSSSPATRGLGMGGAFSGPVAPIKTFEVAAGAKIDQRIHRDPNDVLFWQDTPAGMIVINYTDGETMSQVLAGGCCASSEGFLGTSGVPVGN